MEHLPLPERPTKHLEAVEYANQPYDDGPFLEYLDRHPKTIVDDEGRHFINEVDLHGHYQSWLFFGLLCEFLGPGFEHQDFLRQNSDDGSTFLTTRYLPLLLRTWKDETSQQIMTEDPTFSHISQCLDIIKRKLELTFWNYHGHSIEFGLQVDIIASVAEAIENTVAEVYEGFNKPIIGDFGKRWDWLRVSYQKTKDVHESTVSHMRRHGWCPNDIAMAENRFPTFEAWHYFQHIQLEKDPKQHTECNEDVCKVSSAPRGVCTPLHVTSDCSCESLEIDAEWVTRTYQDEAIPLLEITPDPSVISRKDCQNVELHELKMSVKTIGMKDTPVSSYVVVSHVWGEGIGNTEGNSLPKCRLWHFWRKICPWRAGPTPDSEITPLRLWIDTLCLPREDKSKVSPGSKMKNIYANAAFLFVVDRSMIEMSSTRPPSLEVATRLWLSPWMRRLWTAFEAVVTGKDQNGTVVFQFGESVWDWTSMYRNMARKSKTGQSFANELAKEFTWLEKWLWFGQGDHPPLGTLKFLFHIVQNRYADAAIDEPFVLGTLLKFSSDLFTGGSHETDIRRFWKAISEAESVVEPGVKLLQKQILFYPVPKLTSPGFRWAPRSLLNHETRYSPEIFNPSTGIPGYECQVTDRGLLASYPAIKIRRVSAQRTCCLFGDGEACERGNATMMIELPDGSWNVTRSICHDDAIDEVRPRDLIANGEIFLLKHSQDVPLEDIHILGVWVRIDEETDGVKYAHLVGYAGVTRAKINSAKYATASRECALKVLDELESEFPGTGNEPSVDAIVEIRDRIVRQHLTENPSLLEVIRLSDRTDADDRLDLTFDDCVKNFTIPVHFWGHVGRTSISVLPAETKWCVD